jgi:hypothetical protein
VNDNVRKQIVKAYFDGLAAKAFSAACCAQSAALTLALLHRLR